MARLYQSIKSPTIRSSANRPTRSKHDRVTAQNAAILQANQRKTVLVQLIATADRLSARLDNLARQIQTFTTESADDFARLGIPADSVLRVTMDKVPITEARKRFVTEQSSIVQSLDTNVSGSLAQEKAKIEASIKKLEDELDNVPAMCA